MANQSVTEVNSRDNINIDHILEEWIVKSLDRNPNLAKKIDLIYQINISRNGTVFSSWILDLTNGKGSVYRNPKQEVKCSVTLDEKDLLRALEDKNHWRTLFIKRQMVLKGSRVALEKLQQFWIEADYNKNQVKAQHSSNDDLKALIDSINNNGFKSDLIFYTLKSRMHEEKDIIDKLSGIMQFNITKGDEQKIWTIDFSLPIGQKVYRGPPEATPVCTLTMDDENFSKMMVNKLNPQKAFMLGKMKIKGQIMAIYKLYNVWIEAAFKKNRAKELPYIAEFISKL